jgi:hypothetical protein
MKLYSVLEEGAIQIMNCEVGRMRWVVGNEMGRRKAFL